MHASDLAAGLPVVERDTTALAAARLIAAADLAALVVADTRGTPVAVVSAVDVLGLLVPGYVLDDLSLAGVLDESASEEVWGRAREHTIGELLDDDRVRVVDLIEVDADATILEVAAQMADARAQIALVVGGDGAQPVFVTLRAVMDAILTFAAIDKPQADG